MTATELPGDLARGREMILAETGLVGNDVGALPDEDHKEKGGYHCGCKDHIDIGRWGTAGSSTAGYSVRQERDRIGGNACSAIDTGDNWPHGGRAAWLRFNNWLVELLIARDPELRALRAVNFSPDGVVCRRYDTLHPEAGIIVSTDTVYMHTHKEWWRDTAGTAARWASILRVVQIIRAAVLNDKGMLTMTASEWHTGEQSGPFITQGPAGVAGQQRDTVAGWTWAGVNSANAKLDALIAAQDFDAEELAQIEAASKAGTLEAIAESRDALVAAIVAALPEPEFSGGDSGQPGYTLGQVTDAVRAVFADAGSTADDSPSQTA